MEILGTKLCIGLGATLSLSNRSIIIIIIIIIIITIIIITKVKIMKQFSDNVGMESDLEKCAKARLS